LDHKRLANPTSAAITTPAIVAPVTTASEDWSSLEEADRQRIEGPPLAASDQAPRVDDVEVLFCWSSGFWCSAITWFQRSRRSAESALSWSLR
jgi:hypothetical protein